MGVNPRYLISRAIIGAIFLCVIAGSLPFSDTSIPFPLGLAQAATATVSQGNSCPPNKQLSDIPEVVQSFVNVLARNALEKWREAFKHGGDPPDLFTTKLEDVCGIVVRVNVPQDRALFIFQENGLHGAIFYHLILFDPVTKSITEKPPAIYGKWMKEGGDWGAKFLESAISFDDIDQDGTPEIVVPERVHNGTMYNADVYHYFKIGRDLSLHRLLALETELIDLNTDGLIIRTLTKLAPNQLKLETTLRVWNRQPEKLGEVILIKGNDYSPFRVGTRHVINSRYEQLLITGSEMVEEDEFLRDGYTFYY